MTNRSYTFSHAADIGVGGEAATIGEAFACAARAMFGVMTDLSLVRPAEEVVIECDASDEEILLVKWLNALLAEADLRGMMFCDFQVELAGGRLRGIARGERYDAARHVPGTEVKGATLTELSVSRTADGWRAQTVVDV